jgi:hypothetical protein
VYCLLPSDFEDISKRIKVTDTNFADIMARFNSNPDEVKPILYTWSDPINESGLRYSPDKPPVKADRHELGVDLEEKINSKSSASTRSHSSTQTCRRADGNKCVFCGYDVVDGLEVAHFFEVGDLKGRWDSAENEEKLASVKLLNPNDMVNLMTLCYMCHKYFDKKGKFKLGLNPNLSLEVVESFRKVATPVPGQIYGSLHGKRIIFYRPTHYQPLKEVIAYHYNLFVEYNMKKS